MTRLSTSGPDTRTRHDQGNPENVDISRGMGDNKILTAGFADQAGICAVGLEIRRD